MAVGILSIGSHVPDRIVTNQDISSWAGTTEEWIAERTGVLERRYAEPGTTTSDLALPAARQALQGLDARARERLAAVVVATCTPDVPRRPRPRSFSGSWVCVRCPPSTSTRSAAVSCTA